MMFQTKPAVYFWVGKQETNPYTLSENPASVNSTSAIKRGSLKG